ncbi:uncharacterized protein EAE97_004827 [Botrytis byssoidea]|uniref:Uncharacterized protein n=1 Tax=Botrytis byssoidea TaxID=139641 RepID=A0A9P5ILA9_9HELO|nr:uncharacterized protein EAE97_004827 [Botrytis byssoidea]KAF7945789.1 hypothetical protein EAE97_004827 [Botrytis byssoidea]
MSRLSKYMTSHLQETPQAPQSPRQSIELDTVDATGTSLNSPRADQMSREIEDGASNKIQKKLVDPIAKLQKNPWFLTTILIINSFANIWTVNRIRQFTTPLENQKFTEAELRKHEQGLCFVAAATLFLLNSIFWGFNLHSINKCFGIYLGWKRQMDTTCDGFDTRIELSDPSVDYFGLHNRTTYEARIHNNHLYTQTPGLYPYPSWKDYESYKSGIDLFNITRMNNTAPRSPKSSNSKPFDQFWRIMGIFGDKPLHMDFDLLYRSWRMKEGTIVIDSQDPSSSFYRGGVLFDRLKSGEIYDSKKTSHLVPNFGIAIQNLHEVRHGTWTDTDTKNLELTFPELDLHIPMWGLFEKHCVYQSFMRVFRRPTDKIRKTWNTWSKESSGGEVMRTASFGYSGQKGLEVCVKRREYTWIDHGVKVTEPGLGEDLLVPLGLMAVFWQMSLVSSVSNEEISYLQVMFLPISLTKDAAMLCSSPAPVPQEPYLFTHYYVIHVVNISFTFRPVVKLCKHNIYAEHPPLPGLLFELAAASSLEIFEPKPHFLIAGVARQIGEWAIQTPENRVEFHESFRTEGILGLFELCKKRGKLTPDEIRDLFDRKSTLSSLVFIHLQHYNRAFYDESTEMLPYLQIAMFGGLFAASVRNFCEPGVTNPLHTSIRLDCPLGSEVIKLLLINAALQTPTLISMMKRIPNCFETSAEDCRDISYDSTYHDRNFAFSAFIYLQGWDSLDLMYQVEVGTTSLNAQAAVDAAIIAFRMETSQVTNFKIISNDMIEGTFEDLGSVVNIELDTHFYGVVTHRLKLQTSKPKKSLPLPQLDLAKRTPDFS